MSDQARDLPSPEVDQLIRTHYHEMESLNSKLQDAKERQEYMLREKLEAKRIKKERYVSMGTCTCIIDLLSIDPLYTTFINRPDTVQYDMSNGSQILVV